MVHLEQQRFYLKYHNMPPYADFPPVINPFKPEFTILIFIHYKPRIAIAILWLVVDEDDLKWMAKEKI